MSETIRGMLLLLRLNRFAQAVGTQAGGVRLDGHDGGEVEAPAALTACGDSTDKGFATLRADPFSCARLFFVLHGAKCRRWDGVGSMVGLWWKKKWKVESDEWKVKRWLNRKGAKGDSHSKTKLHS